MIKDIEEIDLRVEGRLDLVWQQRKSGVILPCSLGV